MTVAPIAAAWRAARPARRTRTSPLVLLVTYLATHLPAARWLLRLAGLGALVASAWVWSLVAGLAALGVALLLLEWVSDRG